MNEVFQYPSELFSLMVDAIPALCRSKKDVILFFKGSGVGQEYLSSWEGKLLANANAVKKHEITRDVLTRINERGDKTLRERREVLRRVTEFENFSVCWPEDQLKARGLVAAVREIVNVKDSFTRMNKERQSEVEKRKATADSKAQLVKKVREEREHIKKDLYALFSEDDPHKRGKSLESVLNRLFRSYGILLHEDFKLREHDGNRVIEQIDGIIDFEGHLYLVEMKWWQDKIDQADLSQHMVRVYHRHAARGLFISNSGYTPSAIRIGQESLLQSVFILSELREIVCLLDGERDLKAWLRERVNSAIVGKSAYKPILSQ